MKILYLSCHEVLEYDEVKLLTELGYEVHSHGAYRDPRGAYTLKRPGIDGMKLDESFLKLTADNPATALPPELIEPYDTIIIMSGQNESILINNWKNIKHKRVILRTIGQSIPATEYAVQKMRKEGLQIVRYSPKEENYPNYAGGDAVIRFYKDPKDFDGWVGNIELPVNFTQTLRGRGRSVHYEEIMGVLSNYIGSKVYGPGNNDLGKFNGGEVSFDRLKEIMKSHRAFIYGGTWPACYTLSFMEVMMTGMPIVAMGKEMVYKDAEPLDYYEVDEIIENGVSGFVCHTVPEMCDKIDILLADHNLAKEMGQKGRARAIELFGKEAIAKQWREFLG